MLLTQLMFEGEVLLPAPSWVSYQPQAFIAKNKVHWVQTTSDSNWFPTAEQLESKIKKATTLNELEDLYAPYKSKRKFNKDIGLHLWCMEND